MFSSILALFMACQSFAESPKQVELKAKLTPLQYKVTQENGTEPAFNNAYWDNEKAGVYVDLVSGEALFSSTHKYKSGTGWPSFYRPLEDSNIVEKADRGIWGTRSEIRSLMGNAHIGHVFNDGPEPTGLRYCMNSAAMKFIPVADMAQAGYEDYLYVFTSETTDVSLPDKEIAYLAGGCFWGMEQIIRKIPGVLNTDVGYTGGRLDTPTYADVKKGKSGHAESVKITFDRKRLSYEQLLEYFFRMHDPTTLNRQGNDVGDQYRSAIFYLSESQHRVADSAVAKINASRKWSKPIVTEVLQAGEWTDAEDYHQDYLVVQPDGYTCHYLRD